jgi:hypothetical protein
MKAESNVLSSEILDKPKCEPSKPEGDIVVESSKIEDEKDELLDELEKVPS